MFLIVGLGNPGVEYAATRHNVGVMVLEALAGQLGVGLTRHRFQALTGEGQLGGEKVLLAFPQTFMNLSGRTVQEAAKFYQIPPERVVVVHDELDLPFGQLKLKRGGGHAGHNGLRSICELLGTSDFLRVRVGIGRPPGKQPVVDYVLNPFSVTEKKVLEPLVSEAALAIEKILSDGISAAMNRYNQVRD